MKINCGKMGSFPCKTSALRSHTSNDSMNVTLLAILSRGGTLSDRHFTPPVSEPEVGNRKKRRLGCGSDLGTSLFSGIVGQDSHMCRRERERGVGGVGSAVAFGT